MRKLAIFSAAFALAAALYVYLLSDVRVLWFAGAGILLSVLARIFKLQRASIACIGLSIGLLWCSCYSLLFLKDILPLDKETCTVTVRVSELPYETDYGVAAVCTMENHQVVLYGGEELLQAAPGDSITGPVRIEVRQDNLYFRSHGTIASLYAEDVLSMKDGTPNFPERIRLWLQGRIDSLYGGETAGLVKALLTGDRSGLSFKTQNDLSVAGLSHAVAVSGMHVSILLTMAAMLCGYQPRLMALLGIPIVILFAFVTGLSPSVCRAAVMQIMLLCAPLARREQDSVTSLGAAAFLLLVQNPWCIASVSFQLSFAAVAGLMCVSGVIQKRLLSLVKKPGRVWRFLVSGLSATLSATLFTLPLTIFYFGIVSIVAPLTNLMALWAVTGVFTLGLSSCLIGGPVTWIASILSRYILGLCDLAASFPYAAATAHNIPLMVWAVAAYGLIAVILLVRRFPVWWTMCAITAGFLCCVIASHVRFTAPAWKMTMLDVGQGQCIILRMGDYTAVVDCGGSNPEKAGEAAARFLHSAGMTHADALILTHFDDDHAGGAAQFLSRIKTDMVYLPDGLDPDGIAPTIEAQTDEVCRISTQVRICAPGGELTIYPPISKENTNNSGLCVLATAEEYDILITGDLNEPAERILLRQWQLPEVDLLVAGHHGAKTSTSQTLLDAVRPEAVAISVGEGNFYGHPHEELLERLENMDIQIYRTDLMGDLTFSN